MYYPTPEMVSSLKFPKLTPIVLKLPAIDAVFYNH